MKFAGKFSEQILADHLGPAAQLEDFLDLTGKEVVDVAKRAASTREVMTDKVPQARIYRAWNVPQVGTIDVDQLQLLAYDHNRSNTRSELHL